MMKIFIILGALNTMIAVGTGAFGVHVLDDKLSPKYMSVWEKATTYQMYHGLGLLMIGLISGTTSIDVSWSGWLIFFGIVFFSGSLYILALTEIRVLGAITPIGGILFIIGWLMLIIATFKFAG
ncbi:membrane protein [Staphylococcus saccharolyticus]|uniref:Membrane protein n=2 Tax=Staphylococcus saccharolyticus TaxID=33028 RepID=A0A380H831_9STAP|nr:membrane protein [Staphylococcus saccharolyticus]